MNKSASARLAEDEAYSDELVAKIGQSLKTEEGGAYDPFYVFQK